MNEIGPDSPEIQEALYELRRFLSDEVAPLTVADSVSLLLENDPNIIISGVHSWVEGQLRRQQTAPLASYLYHALSKIRVVGDLNLVPKDRLAAHFQHLSEFAVSYCPPSDRELLVSNLSQLGKVDTGGAVTPINFIYLQGQGGNPNQLAAATSNQDYSKDSGSMLQRFNLLLERLESTAFGGGTGNPQSSLDITARALAMAAGSAQTEAELEHYLQRLGHNSLQTNSQNIITALGQNLPDWALLTNPNQLNDDGSPIKRSNSLLNAMQRVVSLAPEADERAKRFNEIVKAAILEFNHGWLGRAVSMLEVAEDLIADQKIEVSTGKLVRQREHQNISYDRLRVYVESPQQHSLLCKFLSFFEDLSPMGLLAKLRVEEIRNRRRLLITLLEIHGADARADVFKALQKTFQEIGEKIWYFQRNLLHLLHRIPRRIDFCSDDEMHIITSFTGLDQPVQVIREALPNLALKNDARAEKVLISCLKEYEEALLDANKTRLRPSEIRLLLDRVVLVLARVDTRKSRRVIFEHGLKRQPLFGNTLARMVELGSQDFSNDPEFIESVLLALARELPNKIMSLFVKRDDMDAVYLIKALSGTPSFSVRRFLTAVAKNHSARDFGKAAAEVLANFDEVKTKPAVTAIIQDSVQVNNSAHDSASPALLPLDDSLIEPQSPAAATAALSGDLALFGLPALLQNLGDSRLSGVLTLKDRADEIIGTITLDEGKIRSSSAQRLRGVDAVYQLLQKPLAGTFQFVKLENLQTSENDANAEESGEPLDLIPVLLEGMRRYDELQASTAVVPDNATFTLTEVEPAPHEEEQDGEFVQSVWKEVAAGATAAGSEEHLAVDSYRIRRLLTHWVEQGALKLVVPEQSA